MKDQLYPEDHRDTTGAERQRDRGEGLRVGRWRAGSRSRRGGAAHGIARLNGAMDSGGFAVYFGVESARHLGEAGKVPFRFGVFLQLLSGFLGAEVS